MTTKTKTKGRAAPSKVKSQHKRRAPSDGPAISQHGEQLTDLETEEQRIALARRAAAAQGLNDLTPAELEFLKPPPPSTRQEMTDDEAHARAIGAFRIVAPVAPMVPDVLLDSKFGVRHANRQDPRVQGTVEFLDRERKEIERKMRGGKAEVISEEEAARKLAGVEDPVARARMMRGR